MLNATDFITRVLADIFPGKAAHAGNDAPSPTAEPVASQAAPGARGACADVGPQVIGQGAANETHITIDGIPNLFVDEGDCVVQFVPAFDEAVKETPFGIKVLPELDPHWVEAATHRCNLREALSQAIRGASQKTATPTATPASLSREGHSVVERLQEPLDDVGHGGDMTAPARRPAASGDTGPGVDAVTGRITAWGEEKFPRRKPGGPRFYTSFAIRLQTHSAERVLQGEGLKDAISGSGCQVGDVVSVRRLRKIKVQAFNHDGTARMKDGKPVLWDKWLWSISR